jgi:hypothetical protein
MKTPALGQLILNIFWIFFWKHLFNASKKDGTGGYVVVTKWVGRTADLINSSPNRSNRSTIHKGKAINTKQRT